MNKEIKFDNYLSENGIKCFEKLNCDGEGALYKSYYDLSGNKVIFLIEIDSSIYSMFSCRLIRMKNSSKREEVLHLINQLNASYKSKKFILTDEDEIDLYVPFINTEQDFDPEVIILIASSVMEGLEEDYAKIMKIIWS